MLRKSLHGMFNKPLLACSCAAGINTYIVVLVQNKVAMLMFLN